MIPTLPTIWLCNPTITDISSCKEQTDQILSCSLKIPNKFIIKGLQSKLKIPSSKLLMNMSHVGNTSSSSIPIVLSKFLDKIPRNKNLLLIGFGGGLSWGISSLKS